jgi:hypothetical protein
MGGMGLGGEMVWGDAMETGAFRRTALGFDLHI